MAVAENSSPQNTYMPMTMTGVQPVKISGTWSVRLHQWLPLLGLFLSYPLALVCPVNTYSSLVFYFALPTFMWLSLMTSASLLLSPLRPYSGREVVADTHPAVRYVVQFGFVLVVVLCTASALLKGTRSPTDWLVMVGFFAVPLYFATCPRYLLPPRLPRVLALLWLLQALHGAWQVYVHFEVVGLAGNRNWMATTVLCLVPWVWLYIDSLERPRRAEKLALCGAAGLLSLGLAWRCESRGAWLALGSYVVLFLVLPRFVWLLRIILAIGIAGILFFAALTYPERIAQSINEDIRLPLWTQTLLMIRDHPVLGVGPGNFRAEYVHYKSLAHKGRAVAAPVTEHPHNEWLNVGASLGIPGVLLWIVLGFPLIRPPPKNRFWRTVHYAAWMIWVHAFFDKVLIQPPTQILGFMFLGLLWRPLLPVRLRPELRPVRLQQVAVVVGWLLLVVGVAYGTRLAASTWYVRRGMVCENANDGAGALAAYSLAARWNPKDVQTHVSAGMVASNRLRDPETAMHHLLNAFQQEPDFAHLNGEIGVALGSKREHRKALPFFERDASLFPYDPVALRRVLQCKLVLEDSSDLEETALRLAYQEHRQVLIRLGAEQTRFLAGRLMRGLQSQQPDEAMLAAGELTQAVDCSLGDPAFFSLVPAGQSSQEFFYRAYNRDDVLYWQAALQLHRRTANWRLPGDAATAATTATGATAASSQRMFVECKDVPSGGVLQVALFLYQAGYEVALLSDPQRAPLGVLEVHREGQVWLLAPECRLLVQGMSVETLAVDAEMASRFGLTQAAVKGATLSVPVSALDFCGRTQALAHVLRSEYQDLAPRFGEIPSVRLSRYRAVAGPGALPVVFTLLVPKSALVAAPPTAP